MGAEFVADRYEVFIELSALKTSLQVLRFRRRISRFYPKEKIKNYFPLK